jgi:hypothetical protein
VLVTGACVKVLTAVLVTGAWVTVFVTVFVTVTVGLALLVAVAGESGVVGALEVPPVTGVKISLGGLGASLLCMFLAELAVVVRTNA